MKLVIRKGKNITGLTQMGWVAVLVIGIVIINGYNAGWFSDTPVQRAIDSVLDVEQDITVGFNDVYFKVNVVNKSGDTLTEEVIVYAYGWNDNLKGTARVSNGIATFGFLVQEGSYINLVAFVDTDDSIITSLGFPELYQTFRIGNGDPGDTVYAYNIDTGEAVIYFE